MARQRQVSSIPDLRADARERAALGQSLSAALSVLARLYRDIPRSTIESEYRAALREQDAVGLLLRQHMGRIARPSSILGCEDPSQTVHVGIEVRWYDEGAGRTRRYYAPAELGQSGRMGDLLDEAISNVVDQARANGYATPDVTRRMTGGDARYRITWAECR